MGGVKPKAPAGEGATGSARDPRALASPSSREPTATISPFEVAELLLGVHAVGNFSSITLEPEKGAHVLTFHRGEVHVGRLWIDDDVAAAAVVRVAATTGLSALPEPGRATNVARSRVRVGDQRAELLVTIVARGAGFDVEARVLSIDGRELAAAARPALRRCPACGELYAGYLDRCERDDAALVDVFDDTREGGTIGCYRLGSLLGKGGMGSVFEATHVLLGREVAIKVMHKSLANGAAVRAMFLFEARATSRLRHPGTVELLDFGILGDGRPYLVMERLTGTSLDKRLAARGALPVDEAMHMGLAIADALAIAHEEGIIHNDLKPSNVFLMTDRHDEPRPPVKLIDFGAASLASHAGEAEEFVVGTPRYISPERAAGEMPDARSDLYSLGVLLYELVSGEAPFVAENPQSVMAAHMGREPEPVTSPLGELPKRVGRLIARAMRKDPEERYQSAAEMSTDLLRALEVASRPSWRRWLP